MEKFKYLAPEESADAMVGNVKELRRIENSLREHFVQYDYNEVVLPSFEYVDLYQTMDVGIEEERMFQFFNHEGKRIALRADYTVPLARLYHKQGAGQVLRYAYFGPVYRKEKRHKGRSNEILQAGIELMGVSGERGDLECLRLIQDTLPSLQLKDIKIELSSAKFYHRLVDLVKDSEFVSILKRRDISSMMTLIERNKIKGSLQSLLMMLPGAFGDIDIIHQTLAIVEDQELKDALLELKNLYEQLENKDIFTFDLAMTPSMKYYTGIIIKGYSSYSAHPILNGGRYDTLLQHFHQDVPAIGFCYDLSHVMSALNKEEESND